MEWAVKQPINDLILACVFGAQIGWTYASLFAIATLSFWGRSSSRLVTFIVTITATILTLLISRTSYHTSILETSTSTFTQLAVYYLLLLNCWLFGMRATRNTVSPSQSQFSLQDALIGFTLLAVFLALIRVNGNRLQPAILQDFGLATNYPNMLASSALFGLILSCLALSICHLARSRFPLIVTGATIFFAATAATLLSAGVFFANSTLFHGYKFELPWFLETIKYQTPTVIAFTLWFSASIYLFQFLGLLPISQPRVLT